MKSQIYHDFDFQPSWYRAWTGLGATGNGHAVRDALLAAYREPQRKYHTTQHLAECLAWFERVHSVVPQAAAVEMALWFHDGIYNVFGGDNEKRSAQWAANALGAVGVAPPMVELVDALIMATLHSAQPTTAEAQWLVDIDLAILGAPPQRYAEFEKQVRSEYSYVPSLLFWPKRRSILRSFVARPRIYSSDYFFALLEAQARANLTQAMG